MSSYLRVLERMQQAATRSGRNINDITLVAVTKGRLITDIQSLYAQGCRNFGENRVQEALPKIDQIADAKWHFIGTLQKNKVAKMIGKFEWIHSVDSVELAEKISQASVSAGLISKILLEVNVSGEASKHGLPPDVWRQNYVNVKTFPGLHIGGLMTMAPLTDDQQLIRNTFRNLRKLRDELALPHLSMGMSQDFEIAIEEGATMIRVGSAFF